jgi:hypothetical protein
MLETKKAGFSLWLLGGQLEGLFSLPLATTRWTSNKGRHTDADALVRPRAVHNGGFRLSNKFQAWIEAKKKFRLTDVQIQMARELGMNPKKFGSLANHKQEPWKAPLPEFIEDLYFKRFKKDRPDVVTKL